MNTNGFLAPALGVHIWRSLWAGDFSGVPLPREHVESWGGPVSREYYLKLDNMQWQEPPLTRVQVAAVLVAFVRDDATGYANQDRVTAVRRIFDELVPGARHLSQMQEQHWPAIVRQIQELQS